MSSAKKTPKAKASKAEPKAAKSEPKAEKAKAEVKADNVKVVGDAKEAAQPAAEEEVRALATLKAKQPLENWSYKPRALQEDDVEIKISHCGVCRSDIHQMDNDWNHAEYPIVPGHEIIGVVVARGSKVTTPIGARVGVGPNIGGCDKCNLCERGEQNYCAEGVSVYNSKDKYGAWTYGGFSTSIRCDHRFAHLIPEKLDSVNAAPLLCAGMTVFAPLKRHSKPGMKVGILGIGGLGHLALQFSHAMGNKTVAISSSANKADEAKKFGAEEFLNTADAKQLAEYDGKLDFILSTVSSEIDWAVYLRLLRTGGTICFVGLPGVPYKIDGELLIFRRLNICGSLLSTREEMDEMLALAAEKGIVAQTELFSTKDHAKAVQKVRENTIRYRAVLKIDL